MGILAPDGQGGSVWMRAMGVVVALLFVLLSGAAGCGANGLVNRLNLLGQTRFKVDEQAYGLEGVNWTETEVEISLTRAVPAGDVSQRDADAISAVEGIVLVDAAGERLPVGEVAVRSAEDGGGSVVLVFDVSGHAGPWSLEWPGHEPYAFGP